MYNYGPQTIKSRNDMDNTDDSTLAAMRNQFLQDALGECLPLAHIDGIVARLYPNEKLPAQQDLVLRAIRSLLNDGLIVVGDIVGGSDERVEPWGLTIDDIVRRVHNRYVDNHDEQTWSFNTWFALSERGQHRVETQRDGHVS